jgi:hypothetical protein
VHALFPGALRLHELGREVLGSEDLADLDVGLVPRMRARALLRPRDRFVERLALQIQKPATSSFVSVNGPSTTLFLLSFENLTRAPFELGCSPSAASMTPAWISSSLKRPMSSKACAFGITPASESFVAFTNTRNRGIAISFRRVSLRS